MNKIISFYNKEAVNTGRQKEVDILKAVSILFMVLCHAVMYLNFEYDSFFFNFADIYLGGFLGAAPGFMICMGIGISYTTKNDPKSLFIRGIKIFIISYLLNIFRTAIPSILFNDNQFLYYFLAGDILQFAGIAFMVTALIKKIKVPSIVVLVVSIALSSVAPLFNYLETGKLVIDSLVNLIIPTSNSYCAFSFTSWYIFVVIGMCLADTIKRINNLDKFYLIMLAPTLIITVITVIIFTQNYNNDLFYYGMHFLYAFGYACSSLFLLACFHFLGKVLPEKIYKVCLTSSKNIMVIYIIHWLIIGPTIFHMIYDTPNGLPMIYAYLFGLLVWVVSYFLAIAYSNIKRKIKNNITKKSLAQ